MRITFFSLARKCVLVWTQVLFWGVVTSVSAQDFRKGEVPDWVEIVPIPEMAINGGGVAVAGITYLLDDQYYFDGDALSIFTRSVVEITSRSDVEYYASQVREFDPATEKMVLARVVVLRGGVASDRMKETRTDAFRRESDLDAGIYTGTLNASIDIPDVRIGDVLDVSFLRIERRPIAGAPFAALLFADFYDPVGESRVSVLWPKDIPLTLIDSADPTPTPIETTDGSLRRIAWSVTKPKPIEPQEASPSLRDGRRFIGFSEAADWGPVESSIRAHYTAVHDLPKPWQMRLDDIAAASPDPGTRAIAALRLVQEEIRYLSLSIGEGGYLARSPTEVLATGYGDCKDKSQLLRVSLGYLGITSHVALTDLNEGHSLPLWPFSLWSFDHMILRAEIDGQPVWMDATGFAQAGDFDHHVTPDYGFALPIGQEKPARQLEKMTVTEKDRWVTDVQESYAFLPDGIYLTVVSRYLGPAADDRRYRVLNDGLRQITEDYADFYDGIYPGIESLADVTVNDDLAKNRLQTTETYRLPMEALDQNGLREEFLFSAYDFASYLPKSQKGERIAPVYIGMATKNTHRVIVRTAPIVFEPPEPVMLDNNGFSFHFKAIAPIEGSMFLNWEFETKAREIAADDFDQLSRDARKVEDVTGFNWSLVPEEAAE